MDRNPIVAGQFYPDSKTALEREATGYLASAKVKAKEPTLLAMVPHAGYFYSGRVAGETIGAASLAPTVLLLGPNHTGRGLPLSLWSSGAWKTPLGPVPVDEAMAEAIMSTEPRIVADEEAHLQEHSLEVVVPFLQLANPGVKIVPVAVAEPRYEVLESVAAGLAAALQARRGEVSMVVSSDMSHYLPDDETRRRDSLALQAVLDLSPRALYDVVRRNNISMCGVLPMTLALLAARELGASKAEVVSYATSGDAGGDYSRVVGYAGVLVS